MGTTWNTQEHACGQAVAGSVLPTYVYIFISQQETDSSQATQANLKRFASIVWRAALEREARSGGSRNQVCRCIYFCVCLTNY
jgi:hypothetical protein